MKFKLAGKEFDVQPAKTGSVLQVEETLGKSLGQIGENFTFSDIIEIVNIALQQSDKEMTSDWLKDNTSISDMPTFNEVVAHFLEVPK